MAAAVRLQLLRAPRWSTCDGAAALNRKDAALLALLAVDAPQTRERLVRWLWPDDPADKARNTLRQRLFRLRHAAGVEMAAGDDRLALAGGVVHDLHLSDAEIEADPEASAGDLLGDDPYDDLPEFGRWLVAARERWRAQRRDTLARLASRLEADNRVVAALALAARLVRDEPLLEHAQRRLMRLHYRRGDRSAALAVFERFREALDRELGETPSAETQRLVALIEASLELPTAPPPVPPGLLRPPRLIGRAAAWRLLEDAWAARRLALVRGDPGIGKSRLLEDFATVHSLRVVVRARPGDERVPYALTVRLLRAIDEAARTLGEQVPAELKRELAALLPEWGDAAARPLEAARLRPALARALALPWLDAVLVDDAQFADAATLEQWPDWVAAGTPARWVVALRSAEQPAAWVHALAQLDASRWSLCELLPLTLPDTIELLASLHVDGLDVRAWAPRLHRHAGGNPMFMLETLLAALRRAPDASDDGTLPVPAHLGRLLEARLVQLPAGALKLARLMAVAGQDLDVELAADVLGVHALDLTDDWHRLEEAGVTVGGALAHDLIQQALVGVLPPPLAQWLHRQVAQRLLGRAEAAPRCALHWRAAGEPGQAARAFAVAAELARSRDRRVEECAWLDQAAEAFGEAGEAPRAFEVRAQAVIAAREVHTPDEARRRAAALVAAAADDAQRALAHKELGVCHLQMASFDAAATEFDAAERLFEAVGDAHHLGHVRYLRALASVHAQGAAQAVSRLQALLPWAEALADDALRHAFGSDFAIVLDLSDQRQRAQPWFERSIAFFDRIGDRADAAAARMMLGRSLLLRGRGREALALLEAALRDRGGLSEGGGGQGMEALHLGRACVELGHFGRALELLEPSLERFAAAGSWAPMAACAVALARAFAQLGQAARALSTLERCTDEALEALPPSSRASVLWARAVLHPARADVRIALFDRALACFAHADLASVRLPIVFDRLAVEAAPHWRTRVAAALAECDLRELPAVAVMGRVRGLQLALAEGVGADDLAHAEHLLERAAACTPVGLDRLDLALVCWQVAHAAGAEHLASRALGQGLAELDECLREHVPPAFHASFCQRHAGHRALLAAGGRL